MKFVAFAIIRPDQPDRVKRVAVLTDDPEAVARQFLASGWQVVEFEEKPEADVGADEMQLARRNTEIVQSGWTTGPESASGGRNASITSVTGMALTRDRELRPQADPAPGNELEAAVRHAAAAARQGVDVTVTFTKTDGQNEMRVTVNNTESRKAKLWVTAGVVAAVLIVLLALLSHL